MDHHRHTCKLCFRRFPNGRALGGHMRSHVTSAAAAARHQQPPPPAAPPPPQPHASATHLLHQHSSSSSPSYSPSPGSHDELMANRTETSAYGGAGGRGSASAIAAASPGYVLRENPKKSYRMVDPEFSSTFAAPPPPTSVLDYGYYSTTTSSPVFGNGSTATANGNNTNNNHSSSAVVQDGESETESSKAPAASSFRRRSKRRRRYELCAEAEEEDDDDQKLQHLRRNTSTGRKMKKIPVSEPDHPVSSVSDTTPDEDVALCLMMMSRDAGSWNKDEIGIGEQQGDREDGEDDYEIPPNPPFEDDDDYFVDVAADHGEEEDDYDQGGMFRSGSAAGGKVRMPMQRKGGGRARFQCGTCKKVFRSYQALGGHRASHKKAKTCSAAATVAPLPIPPYSAPAAAAAEAPASVRRPTARIIVSADHEERHNYRRDHRYYHQQQRKYTINSNHNNRHQPQIQDEEEAEEDDPDWGEGEGDAPAPPDQRIHQCPFCSRVFSSGQALGGHKRSHLIGGAAYRIPYPAIRQNAAAPINNNRPEPAAKKATPAPPTYTGAASTSVSSYKKPAVRGGPSKHLPDNFIDLNLPAPVDEADEDGSYSAVSDADHF